MKAEKNDRANQLDLFGLERQKSYLENKKIAKVNREYALFVPDKMIESLRDSGYRDVRKAINDLIDNSIQALAPRIDIVFTSGKAEEKGARQKVTNIGVLDSGHGMFPEMILEAVAWGGTDRHNARDGFGRFGFGLPTASISVTRTYEVYSKVKGGVWHKVKIDLNEIAEANISGKKFEPTVDKASLPQPVIEYINEQYKMKDLEQGTLVWLMNPDRIRSFTQPNIFESRMLQNMGLTYRNFISKHQLFVNGKRVQHIDPKFLNSEAMYYDIGNGHIAETDRDPIIFEMTRTDDKGNEIKGKVEIRMSWMHPKFQRNLDGSEHKGRLAVMKESNHSYFVICRAGRQIDLIQHPNYQVEGDNIAILNYDRNWCIEIDFEPTLDELFGVTTNKQQIEIDERLWEKFNSLGIPKIVTEFRSKGAEIREKLKEEKKKAKAEAEEVQAKKDSEVVISEYEQVKKTKPSPKKTEEGEEIGREDTKKEAKDTGVSEEEVEKKNRDKADKNPWMIELEHLPGAPFYRVKRWFTQTQIFVNTAHRFYSDIYAQLDSRGQNAMDLFLYVLAKSEIESTDYAEIFYGEARNKWSVELQSLLKLLDKKDPLIVKEAMKDEEKVVSEVLN
jgi:hypothetical protein